MKSGQLLMLTHNHHSYFNVVLFLSHRTYNVQAVSFTPGELVAEMKKYFPNMEVTYEPDERQAIGM